MPQSASAPSSPPSSLSALRPLLVLVDISLFLLLLLVLSLWVLLPLRRSPVSPIEEASIAVSRALQSSVTRWALVGGAALAALGSKRTTTDVDIVSVPGGIRMLKDALATDSRFNVDPRTRHTHFNCTAGGQVEIQIVAPPGTFGSRFDANTVVLERPYGIRVLNPIALLESK